MECSELSVYKKIIQNKYNLHYPYPNPFNPTTTISFSIPQLGMVSLKVYDITGKLVTTLINEQMNIGYHSIDWDGTNQSSGMYLVRMESGEYVETQKLLLVK
jgi:flagellar hook assembly protein FlgD